MISIIIPTLNEEKYLPTLLDSIQNQTYKDYEVIVADADSEDDTVKIARSFGCKVVKGGMPAAGRNSGAKAAKGEFLFFFDADVKLPKYFLEKAANVIEERYIDLATCRLKPMSNLRIDRILHRSANLIFKFYAKINDAHAPGFCILISKRLFNRIGGFDEQLRLAEDHDLVKRASKFRSLVFLDEPWYFVNVRRLRKEGRLSYVGKVIYSEIYRIIKGEIRKDIVEYEFGDFSKKGGMKKLRELESYIFRLEKKLSLRIKR